MNRYNSTFKIKAAKSPSSGNSHRDSLEASRRATAAIPRQRKPLQRKAKPRKGRKKLPSIKSLHKKAWTQFSIFIRLRTADPQGFVACVTCSARHLWNSGQIQAGHWMHGRLDFDERQINPQCVRCNYYWNTGVNAAYSAFMAREYGADIMQELVLLANTKRNKYSREELQEIVAKYKGLNESRLAAMNNGG